MEDVISKPLFLKKVFLSGYKSIENVDITFQSGLNIIIGKNAAGKTNFLSFLSKILSLNYNELNNFKTELIFQNGKEISIKTEKKIEIGDSFNETSLKSKINSVLSISNKIIKNKKEETFIEKLQEHEIVFNRTFLCHGIPTNYLIVDIPFSFKTEKGKLSTELFKVFQNSDTPYFIKTLTLSLFFDTVDIEELTVIKIREKLTNIFTNVESIKNILNKYSPIEDIRFSENYNIFIDEEKENFSLSNLFLEYKVDGNWLPYSQLSDGTKRLFYIISEITEKKTINIEPASNGKYYPISKISRIILIEEPELGVHPHQFQKLMTFLKEESESKQIIISTHSPQALDSINEKEFNRIIIAYSTKEGTKLRHLNEEELIKANLYIKDEFLSDYWLYSDLEK